MAEIGNLPAPGQKPWSLNEAITAINLEGSATAAVVNTGRLSVSELNKTIDTALSKVTSLKPLTGRAYFDAALLKSNIQRLPLVWLGSSTTAGESVSVPYPMRVVSLMEKMLQLSYNAVGIAGGYTIRSTDDTVWTLTGTHNLPAEGIGVWSRRLLAGATMTHVATSSTGIEILHTRGSGAGQFSVTIDNETPVTVSPSTSGTYRHDTSWKSRVLTRGQHTYKITALTDVVISQVHIFDQDNDSGVLIWNGGAGGTTAGNMTEADKASMWTRIASIAPIAVPVMFGSNDYAQQIPLATFKTQVTALVQKIITTAGTGPIPWIPLIGMPERTISPLTIPYQGYLDVLAEVSASFPNVCTFDNLAPFFPKTQALDFLDLISADDVHPTTLGNRYQASRLGDAWKVPARVVPNGTIPTPQPILADLARDTFTKANGSALGNDETGQPWIYNGGGSAWVVTDGRANMVDNNGAKFVNRNVGTSDFDLTLEYIPTAGSPSIAGIGFMYVDAANRWAFTFDASDNMLKLQKVDNAVATTYLSVPFTLLTDGTSYNMRIVVSGNEIRPYVNNTAYAPYTLTAAEATKYKGAYLHGMRKSTAIGSFDNITIKPLS